MSEIAEDAVKYEHPIVIASAVIWLDQPEQVVKAMTGGRGKSWIWKERAKGLAIHRRGHGMSSRYFIVPSELQQHLIDTSTTTWEAEENDVLRRNGSHRQPRRRQRTDSNGSDAAGTGGGAGTDE